MSATTRPPGRTSTPDRRRTALLRCGSVAAAVAGLGFGVPGVVGVGYLAEHGEVWRLFGLPTYGEGPFDAVGLPASVPLLGAFVAVCAAETGLAVLLWRGRGRRPALLLLPVELVFWTGFALPFGPPLGLARTAAVLLAGPRPRPGRRHREGVPGSATL
ncbi:hypothetical protein [Pseudonocardia hydrocarbonoxydans]|uniref:hypothetical protein n=1 Tax=Pseudonocardia hydrocarbonoxydans TaxID=76726 RepID=UPI001143C1BF|nr:hypothetical protein [Pseudonocardia hydrocarbonoxydans]